MGVRMGRSEEGWEKEEEGTMGGKENGEDGEKRKTAIIRLTKKLVLAYFHFANFFQAVFSGF